MSEVKHTPGPWNVDPATDGRSKGFIRCDKKIAGAIRGIAVARVSETGIGFSEAQANAKLIAAAPDLLGIAILEQAWVDGEDWASEKLHDEFHAQETFFANSADFAKHYFSELRRAAITKAT